MSDFKDTTSAEILKKAEDIMVIKFKPDHYVERDHAIEIIEAMLELAEDKNYFVLVDARVAASNMSTEAQKYLAHESPFNEHTLAVAILLNNLPIRLTANMFIKIQKPPFPTKIFKDEIGAIEWFDKKRRNYQ